MSRWRVDRRVVPWVGSAALVVYLLLSYDLGEVLEALGQARLGWLAFIWLSTIFVSFLIDTACLTVLFGRLNTAISFGELLAIKGASYFINIVNYAAASGGIAYLVSRRSRAPLAETTSSVILLNAVDLLVLNLFVTAGLVIAPLTIPTGTLLAANMAVYALYLGGLVYWNGGIDFLVLGRLRPLSIFHAFRAASLRTHGLLIALRLGLLIVYVAMQYAALHLFSVDVPLGVVLVMNSIITLVGTLPISIAGLGTTQLVMLAVYAPYGTDAQILAYSTAGIFMFMVVRVAIGYVFLDRATSDGAR